MIEREHKGIDNFLSLISQLKKKPPLLFSCGQEMEGQWIGLRWSRQFNWLASQPKKLILLSPGMFIIVLFEGSLKKKEKLWDLKLYWEVLLGCGGEYKGLDCMEMKSEISSYTLCSVHPACGTILVPWNALFVDLWLGVKYRRDAVRKRWFIHGLAINASSHEH